MSFTFTDENLQKIKEHIAKYPKNKQASAVLPLLDLAQRQCEGWLPQPAIEEVSKLLDMPFIRVMEVASFYTMFNLKPVGAFHVQICGTTPCWLKGSSELKSACEQHAAKDPLFTISEVECVGACVNAPVVQINDDYYENLSPEALVEVLEGMRKSKSGLGIQANLDPRVKPEDDTLSIEDDNFSIGDLREARVGFEGEGRIDPRVKPEDDNRERLPEDDNTAIGEILTNTSALNPKISSSNPTMSSSGLTRGSNKTKEKANASSE